MGTNEIYAEAQYQDLRRLDILYHDYGPTWLAAARSGRILDSRSWAQNSPATASCKTTTNIC